MVLFETGIFSQKSCERLIRKTAFSGCFWALITGTLNWKDIF